MEYINCPTCNNFLSGKYKAFDKKVAEYRKDQKLTEIVKIDSTFTIDDIKNLMKNPTPECRAMDELGLRRQCCRVRFLSRTTTNLVEHY